MNSGGRGRPGRLAGPRGTQLGRAERGADLEPPPHLRGLLESEPRASSPDFGKAANGSSRVGACGRTGVTLAFPRPHELHPSELRTSNPAFPGSRSPRPTPPRPGAPQDVHPAEPGARCKQGEETDGGLQTLLIDILLVLFNTTPFVCSDNGSYLTVRAVFRPIITLYKRLPPFLPLVRQHRSGTAHLIEEPAPGRVFRDSLLSPNAVISPSLCWGGIKITKKVILSIFFLIIIVRRGDKPRT